jgi:molybdopterin/thiamine biosynthesis adenylyltransferase
MSRARAFNRPRLKEIFAAYYLPGRVRIGSGYSNASEIPDPEGKFAPLVRMLGGAHELEEIRAELAGTLSEDEIAQALDTLDEAGYLEDAASPPPPDFAEDERQRYKANLNYFATLPGDRSKFEHQRALRETHVALFGLGGIGSNIAMALAELGVGRLTAVDFDRVELSNLNRQVLYGVTGLGELKTDVARRRLADFNPHLDFTGIPLRIASLEGVREVLDDARPDAVINLADRPNGFIDFWINEACVERGLPLFAASIACDVGTAYSVVPGETACYQCRVSRELRESPELEDELEFLRANEFCAANGALGPACMFQAYFVSYELVRHLLQLAPLLTRNRTLEINFVTFEQRYHDFEPVADCPVCASVGMVAAAG